MAMSVQVDTLIKNSCSATGESPHWDETTETLLYVDIENGSLHRWSAATGIDEKYTFDTLCCFAKPCRKGGYIVALDKSICHFDWDTKMLTTLQTVDEGKETHINDGKCDASGKLWFGTMGVEKEQVKVEENMGTLYSLELDGTVRKHKEGVSISNGLAWTEDNRTMYYIDSIPRKVYGYDFDITTGTMSNERVVVDFGGKETMANLGYPDGMTIDTDGKLWVATFLAGRVVRFDPQTGEEIGAVSLPARLITSCCFGGKNFNELFITCGAFELTEEDKAITPLAGSVFRATGLGVAGKPAAMYLGLVQNH
ncbi:hypothetical protein ACF0H5_000247 [Mactra antiquata]